MNFYIDFLLFFIKTKQLLEVILTPLGPHFDIISPFFVQVAPGPHLAVIWEAVGSHLGPLCEACRHIWEAFGGHVGAI